MDTNITNGSVKMLFSYTDPFSLKSWGEFLNQIAFLENNGLTVDDVRKAIVTVERQQKESVKQAEKTVQAMPKCPECGFPLQLLPVNDSPSTQTGDDSKSMWLCRRGGCHAERKCFYQEFSNKTVDEQLKQLNRRINDGAS
jgi:hypothetical protein